VIRITNLNILEKQFAKICERRGVEAVHQLPELATAVAYSPCCDYFKNGFPIKENQGGRGFDEVIYNIADETFTCGKKEHKSSSRQAKPRAIRLGKKVEIFNTKVARQQERENKKQTCRKTEVIVVDLLGEVIETHSSAKLPKSKKQKDTNSKRRRKNLPLPTPPFWITPCCGIIYELDWEKWTPNGYACGVCKDNNVVAEELVKPLCMSCHTVIDVNRTTPTLQYKVVRCFDDVYTNNFRYMIFCNRCIHPWRRFETLYCASHIIYGINNPDEFPDAVALRYT
jgi:hypothetical protein